MPQPTVSPHSYLRFLLRLTFHFLYLVPVPVLPESAGVADTHPNIPVLLPPRGGSSEASSTGAADAPVHTRLNTPCIQHC